MLMYCQYSLKIGPNIEEERYLRTQTVKDTIHPRLSPYSSLQYSQNIPSWLQTAILLKYPGCGGVGKLVIATFTWDLHLA